MRYLFVGYYVNSETFDRISREKINNMSVARQKFEINLIRGLKRHLGDDIEFITYVPTNGIITVPEESIIDEITVKHIAINKKNPISIIKAREAFKAYLNHLNEKDLKNLCILMYAVNPVFESVLLSFKKKYQFQMYTICSEVPEFRRYGKSALSKIKKKILTYYNEKFDGYILFSKEMGKVVRCSGKKTMVLEGIAPNDIRKPHTGKKNIVMYAGGLAKDNNILFLIECCKHVSDLYELWICGAGPDADAIQKQAERNHKIKFWGSVPNDKVLEMESEAKILINCRATEEELTKYSFPSKILEYIAAGSMVMSSRLIGIPNEYFDYIIPINEKNQDDTIQKINDVLAMDDCEYIDKVNRAQEYIQENKNYIAQTERIVKFMQGADFRNSSWVYKEN